jgi:transaldolase
MTTVVSDSGDFNNLSAFGVTDSTTNPSLILKAAKLGTYDEMIDEAVVWGRSHNMMTSQITDRIAVNFGAELTKVVPGRVSTEVDADLSFDTEATVAKGRAIIADYATRGIPKDRVLIKVAATWEGIRAVEILQKEGIDCNVTLIFCLAQAIAAADAGAFLISPFVGRIMDWYKARDGKSFTPETDPGVVSVKQIYAYFKAYGIKTDVMGASFRNIGEIEALAGCDRLTISPDLLQELSDDTGPLARKLDPQKAVAHAPAKVELDEKTFRLMLNMDAMATEKLADGIRLFAKDLTALRELVSGRVQQAA